MPGIDIDIRRIRAKDLDCACVCVAPAALLLEDDVGAAVEQVVVVADEVEESHGQSFWPFFRTVPSESTDMSTPFTFMWDLLPPDDEDDEDEE